eukprot:scaffold2654_cov84-Skeletonema_dohrnii-CCMP3373.AAC.1
MSLDTSNNDSKTPGHGVEIVAFETNLTSSDRGGRSLKFGGVISWACVDISLRIGALLGFMGLKWQNESSQIWRQLVSDTSELVLIAKHHLLFSSQHAKMIGFMGTSPI